MTNMFLITTNFVFLMLVISDLTDGHGRLIWPPSRSSMWRFGFNNPKNYDDHQLYCGGYSVQWDTNGGRCGVCGDKYNGDRQHEAPFGKYAKNGIIVEKYDVGQLMLVRVHLTVNHMGWFEFRLCQNDILKKNVTQECFDQHLLEDVNGIPRFEVPSENPRYYNFTLQLPQGLRCRNCVLQWKYNTGNNYGFDFVTGEGCMGCGRQEQFFGCSDIAVGYDDVVVGERREDVFVPEGDVDERTEWMNPRTDAYTASSNINIESYITTVLDNRFADFETSFSEMKSTIIKLVELNTKMEGTITQLDEKVNKIRKDLEASEDKYDRLMEHSRGKGLPLYGVHVNRRGSWDTQTSVMNGYASNNIENAHARSKYPEGMRRPNSVHHLNVGYNRAEIPPNGHEQGFRNNRVEIMPTVREQGFRTNRMENVHQHNFRKYIHIPFLKF